jgi:hypothetical protein
MEHDYSVVHADDNLLGKNINAIKMKEILNVNMEADT